MSKIHNYIANQGGQDLILIERSDGYYPIQSPPGGPRRINFFDLHSPDPGKEFRTPGVIIANEFRAGGKTWIGYHQDGDDWYLASWDGEGRTSIVGPLILAAPDQPTFYPHVEYPKPVSVVQHPLYTEQIYVVVDDGTVRLWDGVALSINSTTNAVLWHRRTPTEEARSVGGVSDFGWGNTATLYDELSLFPWVPPTYATFASLAALTAGAPSHDPPGYGAFWHGKLVLIFYFDSRWHGVALGYVYDEGPTPATAESPAALSLYTAVGFWLSKVGGDPAAPGDWEIFLGPWMPWDADGLDGEFNGADKERNIPQVWLSWAEGLPYISACPYQPSFTGMHDQTAVYRFTAAGVMEAVFNFPNQNCYVGPLAVAGTDVYAPVMNVHLGKLQVYKVTPGTPAGTLVAERAYTGDPHLATARIVGKWLYVILGQDHEPVDDSLNVGDGADTGWTIVAFDYVTGASYISTPTFPNATAIDDGLWPRLVLAQRNRGGQAGGGDSSTVPVTGDCGPFSIYNTPTISEAYFTAHLVADGSPIAGVASDVWTDLTTAGIDPNFALALWHKESVCGAVPGELGPLDARNIGNIRPHDWGHGATAGVAHTECCGDFQDYATWQEGWEDWIDLWELGIYHEGGNPANPPLSIPDAIFIYAPPSENDTQFYVDQLCGRMALYQAESAE